MKGTVVVVNYNSGECLHQCLSSLDEAGGDFDVVVVDNASRDTSRDDLARRDKENCRVIFNTENVGFARAVNQGIRASHGDWVLLLNPDSVAHPGSIGAMARFLEAHPDAGVVGGKVLSSDGSLQLACRRSFPTPWVSFCRIVGLAFLFPKSRLFSRYNLTFLDPAETTLVEAVSGSFLMARRAALEQVGLMDEGFFMFAEDIDLCYRMHQGGWRTYYLPAAVVTHAKGVCSRKNPTRVAYEFYNTMWLFHKKHFMKDTFFLVNWLIYGMVSVLKVTAPALRRLRERAE